MGFYLKRNMPWPERCLRLAAGLFIAWVASSGRTTGAASWLAWALAAGFVPTGLVGFCPACAMFGRKPVNGDSP